MSPSAARVLALVQKYGRGYANGELDFGARGKAITGSEIPTICGESRFERPSAVMFKKAFGMRFSDTPATLHGKKYEPIAIAKFREETKATVYYVGFMRHEVCDFIGGTFDALAIMPDGEGVLVEIKCPYTRGVHPSVPEHYVGQVQAYLAIAGLDVCMFAQYKPAYTTPERGFFRPEKMTILRVARDPAYFSARVPVLWEFWKKLCAFREAVLPTADLAARLIQTWWRCSKNKAKKTRNVVRLTASGFKYLRKSYGGVFEGVLVDMERNHKPRMPAFELPHGTTLCVVDDDAGTHKRPSCDLGIIEQKAKVARVK